MANRSFERSSCVSKYLQEISEFPLLTKEEEHDIAVKMEEAGKDGSYHDLVAAVRDVMLPNPDVRPG